MRFTVPVVLAFGTVLSATHLRDLVDWLKASLGDAFVPTMAIVLALSAFSTTLFAIRTIRTDRWQRWALIVIAFGVVVAYVLVSDRGSPAERAMERMHFVIYGAIAVLFYRAFAVAADRIPAISATLMAVTSVGVADEWLQFRLANRTGEVFDLMLNLLGALIGVLIGAALFWPRRADGGEGRSPCRGVGIGLALLGAFLSVGFLGQAHAGHWIVSEDWGAVRSWYSAERLGVLNEARARQWSEGGPDLSFDPWEWQDGFLTQGAFHAKLRNDAVATGDLATAWRENRVLEELYPAMLDAKVDGRFRYRWPAEQRSAIAAAMSEQGIHSDASTYVSPGGEGRILPWLRWWMLLLVLPSLWLLAASPLWTAPLATSTLGRSLRSGGR